MIKKLVEVRLEVVTAKRAVMANLTYTSLSSEPVFLDKTNGCLEGSIENDVFQISANGKRIRYIGILAKRLPPGPKDFVKILPSEKLTASVRLDEAYEFLPGSHTYRARYSALHGYPDRSGFFELASDEMSFSFSK